MKNIIKLLSVTTAMLMTSHTLASEEYSSTFNSCVKVSGGATDALSACYSAEIKAQDSRLNSNYKQAMNVLANQKKPKLQDTQRLWIKFRDSDCEMYYSLTGGTIDILNGADCELSTTKKRADDLAWIAENGSE
ncbi:lysozyme inhibitor LprI family protein [Pseudomonas helleri]|uniref:lysozyme inhibitor LprI family protein n=1 Tax=Pseudomonas helleri TaxID=1608996 RepID=UPI003FD1A002